MPARWGSYPVIVHDNGVHWCTGKQPVSPRRKAPVAPKPAQPQPDAYGVTRAKSDVGAIIKQSASASRFSPAADWRDPHVRSGTARGAMACENAAGNTKRSSAGLAVKAIFVPKMLVRGGLTRWCRHRMSTAAGESARRDNQFGGYRRYQSC